MTLAPIALFVYNRLTCLTRCIEALSSNRLAGDSVLFIYSDGYKNLMDKNDVLNVRNYIAKISGFKEVKIIEREKNLGLAESIISGVTEVLTQYEKIIVLEDDMLTTPFFLTYINEGLELYKDNDKVASINGFFIPAKKELPDTFFLNFADCWGWGTWKKAWNDFEPDGNVLLEKIKGQNLSKRFNLNKTVNYTKMLADQVEGKNNSWAVRWYASTFLKNKLSLCPKHSLVRHIGNDGSGTHLGKTDYLSFELKNESFEVKEIDTIENKTAFHEMAKYFKQFNLVSKEKYYILRQIIPPVFFVIYRKLKKNRSLGNAKPEYGWFGNYPDWDSAKKDSTGYDHTVVLEKVTESVLKVKNGEAIFERDSVLFDKHDYSFPFLSGLMWVAAQNEGKLNMLDFGGSLGSTWFQNKHFLQELKEVKWNIVEQEKFVNKGKEFFEEGPVTFYYSIEECLKDQKINCLLLSSVIQYLERPYKFLNYIIDQNFNYIIFDRTAFIRQESDRLTLQVVPPEIYKASYPAWFFNEQKLLDTFSEKYDLIYSFESLDIYNIPFTYSKGFLFRLKNK